MQIVFARSIVHPTATLTPSTVHVKNAIKDVIHVMVLTITTVSLVELIGHSMVAGVNSTVHSVNIITQKMILVIHAVHFAVLVLALITQTVKFV